MGFYIRSRETGGDDHDVEPRGSNFLRVKAHP